MLPAWRGTARSIAAGGRRLEPRHQPQSGRLAAARGAEQRQKFALANGEIEMRQRNGPVAIELADVLERYERFIHAHLNLARRHGSAAKLYGFGRRSSPTP